MSFADLTIDTAPEASRRSMETVLKHQGFLPSAVARMAHSPEALNGFLRMSGLFETVTLEPVEREVVVMTIATRNSCHLCVAMHTARLAALDADPALVTALRDQQPLPEARLEALRHFTLQVLETAGAVPPAQMQSFLDHGYTQQNALEVVLGIGTYTLSTLANRMTEAPIDGPLAAFAPSAQPA